MSPIHAFGEVEIPVENHPWPPFLPDGCRLLMLGSFPPAPRRWSMEFYYPNFTNDMWRIFGLVFFHDRNHFVDTVHKTFLLDELKTFLRERGVGLSDTACAIRRTQGTASDKDLEVVTPTDLTRLLRQVPACRAVCTTGQKATDVFCQWFGIAAQPQVGGWVEFSFDRRPMRLYRMPSSSRAYPLRLEKKAAQYEPMLNEILT